MVQYVLMNSLKRSNEVMKFVLDTCQNLDACFALLSKVSKDSDCSFLASDEARIELGRYLKETGGARWPPVILLANAKMTIQGFKQGNNLAAEITALNDAINRLQLNDIHERKPLLDGKTICELYGIKPGKIVGSLTAELFDFSILQPKATEQQARDYMLANKDAFQTKYK